MFGILALSILAHYGLAECPAPSVISIPIQNVSLANGANARGIALSVGSPPQNLALMPQWYVSPEPVSALTFAHHCRPFNDTWLFNYQGQCDQIVSQAACMTRRGGYFNENASSTYRAHSSASYAGGFGMPTDNDTITKALWATDILHLASNVSLQDYPIGIPRMDWGGSFHAPSALGLGSNSSILNSLKNSGLIASRTWSMYWGLEGGSSSVQMDGSFVFGGFDRAKVDGDNFTQPLGNNPDACPSGMLVTISDLRLNFPNGTAPSLFQKRSDAMSACIVPDFPGLMTVPWDPYWSLFDNITGTTDISRSFGPNFWGLLYDPSNV